MTNTPEYYQDKYDKIISFGGKANSRDVAMFPNFPQTPEEANFMAMKLRDRPSLSIEEMEAYNVK